MQMEKTNVYEKDMSFLLACLFMLCIMHFFFLYVFSYYACFHIIHEGELSDFLDEHKCLECICILCIGLNSQ